MGAVEAKGFVQMFAKAGLHVEIEGGPVGVVIYGPSRAVVAKVSNHMLGAVRTRDPLASVEKIVEDRDESPATRFVTTLSFDWQVFNSSRAA